MTSSKRGVPKGTVNNPRGANQYVSGKGQGEKDARLQLVLSAADKRILKETAQKKGMSLSTWLVELALEAVAQEKTAFPDLYNCHGANN